MNGAIEEAGSTARTLFGALKDAPATLALLVFNILFVGFVWWSTIEERKWRENVVSLLVKTQGDMADKLHGCVPLGELRDLGLIKGGAGPP
jgi:hypothetical protein